MKTPYQIAWQVVADAGLSADGRVSVKRAAEVAEIAVGLDRSRRGVLVLLAEGVADHPEEYDAEVVARVQAAILDPDNTEEVAEMYLDPMIAELVELYGKPKCDECDKDATEFWPKLAEPVQLCDECTHNARRSGWEPGR